MAKQKMGILKGGDPADGRLGCRQLPRAEQALFYIVQFFAKLASVQNVRRRESTD